ncbi:VOC family protein [Motiliproteus sp. MSK22-1]|uniref:VOC family protein n=1 Tax=Motiliproteus sp. MSK22-1 TaxID=1897630 RepID=UPI0009771193|nr:VOC family protein [Motiliproteus sp. MSK22-1]OMH36217.1 hypothetical protein BGP75_09690 [Motiliproteus sp. MSK22-1]
MKVRFDHLALSAKNPEGMKNFLCDLLGLEVGFRPSFPFDGYFLCADGKEVIHIFEYPVTTIDQSRLEKTGRPEQGIVHHVSFYSDDYGEVMKRLAKLKLNYSVSTVPDSSVRQVFVRAPEGLIIEIQVMQKS